MLETANDENPDDSNAWCRWSSSLTAKQHNSTPVLGRSAPFSLCQLFHLAHNFLFHSAHFFIQATFSLSLQLLFFSLDPKLPFSLDPLFHWGHFFARPTTSFFTQSSTSSFTRPTTYFFTRPTFSLGPQPLGLCLMQSNLPPYLANILSDSSTELTSSNCSKSICF